MSSFCAPTRNGTALYKKTTRTGPVIAVAAFAAFLATFNETFLNVAFVPIMGDFGVGEETVQWLVTGYMLGAAVMVPVTAFLYRTVSTGRLFLFSVGFLVVGSVVGALAPSFAVLLTGRVLQAVGTGMLIPIGMNITLAVAPREKLGAYLGLMGAMTTLGPSVSIIAAGSLLVVTGWTTLLWVFGALSALCFAAGATVLGDVAVLTHPRLDPMSVVTISLALVGILYGISTLFFGNLVTAAAAVVIGAVSLVVFVRRQFRLDEPLLDLSTLRNVPFALGVVMNMLTLVVIFAMNILIPIYVQSTLGEPALAAALALFPAILLSAIVAPLAGRWYDRRGPRLLLPAGFGLIAVFAVLVAAVIPTGSLPLVALAYVPVICGSALVIGPVQSFAVSHLAGHQHPHGVTVMSTGFQLAGCIGSSVFVGVYAAASAASTRPANDAASAGFLAAGLAASACAVAGLIIALVAVRHTPSTGPTSTVTSSTPTSAASPPDRHDLPAETPFRRPPKAADA